jgi:hypothetical protein
MKKILILSAVLLTAVSLACILINQAKKAKKTGKKQTIADATGSQQAFMMDTFEPINDFEMVYFDDQRGLVQIKMKL